MGTDAIEGVLDVNELLVLLKEEMVAAEDVEEPRPASEGEDEVGEAERNSREGGLKS